MSDDYTTNTTSDKPHPCLQCGADVRFSPCCARAAALTAENARLTRELGEMKKAMRMEVIDSAKLESRIARLRALAKVVASESVHSLDRCGCLSAADKLKPLIAACDAHRDLDEGGE